MTLPELLIKVPELETYIRYMPDELRDRCTIRTYPPGTIIHQKDAELDYFGIVCEGYHRVINEFENGNVFMIERNDPIDFVGEVAILAGKSRTSVTLETTTECTVLYFTRKDFEDWIAKDIHFLRLVSQKVAYKLYRFLLQPWQPSVLPASASSPGLHPSVHRGIPFQHCKRTREEIHEETGISVKTLNRTIRKLKEKGLVGITKGKISMTEEQQQKAREYLKRE